MKIQKTTMFTLECLNLEYVLDAILIDNTPEVIKAAALYARCCKRNSWRDRIINIDRLIEILAEMGVDYKDIYDDEAYSDLLEDIGYKEIDIMSRNYEVEEEKNIDADVVKRFIDDEVFEVLVGKFGLKRVKEALDAYREDYGQNGVDYLREVFDADDVMEMLYLEEDGLD